MRDVKDMLVEFAGTIDCYAELNEEFYREAVEKFMDELFAEGYVIVERKALDNSFEDGVRSGAGWR